MITRHSATLTCVLTLLAPLAHAQSQTRHETISGTSLVIDSPCARTVTVHSDGPAGHITLDANADNQEEVAQLLFTNSDSPRLTVEHDCWRPNFSMSFRSTLHVVLHVPAGAPLSIDESGPTQYQVGDLRGPLTLDLSGPVSFRAGRITDLEADLSGPADVYISAIDGKIHTDQSGPGRLEIGTANALDANMDVSGVGGVQVSGGTIGNLHLENSGLAAVSVGATITNASVELSGVGSVRLARVTGSLTKDVSGVGEVSVGGQ
jgi:hypothetical protein